MLNILFNFNILISNLSKTSNPQIAYILNKVWKLVDENNYYK